MINKNEAMAQEIAAQCLRARRAEDQLMDLQQMLDALGVVLWQTDRELRLVGTYGSCIAESFLDRPVDEFYRDVYGIIEPNAAPLAVHRDAQAGQSATVGWQDGIKRYAMIIEPNRDDRGSIIGTVGMALRLTD